MYSSVALNPVSFARYAAGGLVGAASRGRTSQQSHPHSVATHSNVLFAYCRIPSKPSQSFLMYSLITIFSFNYSIPHFLSISPKFQHIAYCISRYVFCNVKQSVQTTKLNLNWKLAKHVGIMVCQGKHLIY